MSHWISSRAFRAFYDGGQLIFNSEWGQGQYSLRHCEAATGLVADKAGSNVIVVCKKYYLDVILKELTNNLDLPTTYVMENTSKVQIVNKHLEDIVGRMGIPVNENMEQLPSFYWLPKLHKTPYGSRFIAATILCVTT